MSKKTTQERLESSHLNKKMTKKLKNRWIKALESGRYKQCAGSLHNSKDQNCCLGVLCRVMNLKHETIKDQGRISSLGLDKVMSHTIEDQLIMMNDTDEKTFDEIADFLRKNKDI